MSIFSWFKNKKKSEPQKPSHAPTPPSSGKPPKPPFPTALQPGQRPWSHGYKPVGPDFHTDAAFSPDEEYSFLYLERRIPVRSSWIEAAQYNSTRKELTFWVQDNPKDYTIPNVDERMAMRFINSTSKGMWYWTNRAR